MARTVTLADLRTRSLIRAGFPSNTAKIDTSTGGWLDDEINNSATALWDKVLLAWGEDYSGTSANVVTVAGTETVALPATFHRLLGVDWYTGGQYREMRPFQWADRNEYQGLSWSDGARPRYMLQGANLLLRPVPTSVETLRVWYVPTLTTVDASHALEGVHGWDEFVVLDVAIKCREACRMDAATLLVDRVRVEDRITAMAPRRDIREPGKVTRRRHRAWARRYL